ncbi:Na/Pi-cotransporter II-related protein [uncultured Roseburia sp.]|uniref:Na/Pi cotransporter family protein n=1 Tax=Brotonthovivens ammoniilytica TaxID=2981725 RepID=A0ABT2TLF2_9FIRM|nr:Na/Pi cotransporter family protein [Brotonthovivens ammoniilytica]MCU6762912.1 Na/Pi cotransporter family protein [Brotonthovivens ammoniilytica]SCI93613.1 Na/Pi-cotransporter II-related protein [uncultured Roseburia sp.]
MDIFGILSMIGGLALFLYGMNVMGSGLEKVSGGRLEQILEKLTSNPIKAVLLGAGVTAVIQSSSATTVMVVGFVNSSIMKLSQAIGLIMGANIGTTITAWLLSLTGIESSNVFLQMLKPSSFSPILAVIGILLYLGGKNSKKKDIGEIMLGFATLMFGMDAMSAAVAPLADVPEFTNILTLFSNPLFGVIAGAVLTGIIQSSSASVGILQALSITGGFTYGSVIPIIMGQNIGTCVTAIISCLSGNRNAKRTALVHLYFNIIGTIIFLALYYILNAIIHFPFTNSVVGPGGIALIHSIFNIFTTFILLPFTKGLEKLAYLTLPRTTEEEQTESKEDRFRMLSDRYLSSPAFALENVRILSCDLANLAKESVGKAMNLLFNYSQKEFDQLEELENTADMYEDRLTSYLSKLNGQNVTFKDGRDISVLQHCITDFERISDLSINIGQYASSIHQQNFEFSKKGREELSVYSEALKDISSRCAQVFINKDQELALSVEPLEEVIDSINKTVNKQHMKRLRNGKCSVELGMLLSDITTHMERISDHCSNIAIYELQLADSSIEEHAYREQLDEIETETFNREYEAFKEKYQIKKS